MDEFLEIQKFKYLNETILTTGQMILDSKNMENLEQQQRNNQGLTLKKAKEKIVKYYIPHCNDIINL